MNIDDILVSLKNDIRPKPLKVDKTSDNRAYAEIDPKDIVPFFELLFKRLGLRLCTISAVDNFDRFEVLYHLAEDKGGCVITLRAALADRNAPKIDTITGVSMSGWWIEREIHELFGIDFEHNKDLRTLLLPDDWPAGVYPLRKDFIPPKRDSRGHAHKPEAK